MLASFQANRGNASDLTFSLRLKRNPTSNQQQLVAKRVIATDIPMTSGML
jgi:hypothetical protein